MMKFVKAAGVIGLLVLSLSGCAQNTKDRARIGREAARKELQAALQGVSRQTIAASAKLLLPDSTLAMQVAEPILFRTYGKQNILRQQPYEAYLINKYWVITGTLPKDLDGGTFLVILDARDSRVIELTHGK